ncbi:MAG: hypothetical protein NTY45_08930 [Elusimicrobia bacterium]|nr:hypothetical protein [Elusimicrobiota bacterium]
MNKHNNPGLRSFFAAAFLLSSVCISGTALCTAAAAEQNFSRPTDAQFADSLAYAAAQAKLAGTGAGTSAFTAAPALPVKAGNAAPSFKKVMIIVLENISYKEALAQSFLAGFARQGALLANFSAETHPSQGNYIALTAGTVAGVTSDKPYNLNVRHLGDLLEAKGRTWKVYAQAYPGNCFSGAQSGNYVRKHVPFLSYTNVQKDPRRCAAIADDSGLSPEIAGGKLPDFSLFIPDIRNDGHDTGVDYAGKWLDSYFTPLLKDPAFMKDMLLVITFDEDDKSTATNHIYTALYGSSVLAGSVSNDSYTHYSLLRTIEDTFGLGTLGQNDSTAGPITGVWR